MRVTQLFYAGMLVFLSSISALGQKQVSDLSVAYQNSPVGRWRTIDDANGKPASIVEIREENGKLIGRIEKVFASFPKESNPKCAACQGELKDAPLVGMKILWDLAKHDDEWAGGKILDPDSGKTYNCSLAPEKGGTRLKVRGFMGMSLFGRTQYWLREK